VQTLTEPTAEIRDTSRAPVVRNRVLILGLIWIFGAVYSGSLLKRGWVPHDEGTISQSAERVLQGQLPHRDFDELYTGGLSFLNAFAFRVFGENLVSPRLVLFGFFLAWIPAVYFVALRFVSPPAAGAITAVAIAFSLPNYSAAVPSWYNLFFATFGLAAVLQFLSSGRRKWLFLAGLAGGLSFLFKLSGLFFIAGALLFFLFREQELNESEATRSKASLYSAFVVTALLAFLASLFLIGRQSLSRVAVFEFIVPTELLALLCMWRQMVPSASPAPVRFRRLFWMLLPFAIGVALPIAALLIPYLHSGSLGEFIQGVFILPGRRLAFAARRPPGLGLNKLLTTLALLALIWAAYANRLRSWLTYVLLGLAFALCIVLSKTEPKLYAALWSPLVLLVSCCTIAGTALLATRKISSTGRQQVFLVLVVTATCSLIQLPFSVPIYFCYVAPLLALSLAALFSTTAKASHVMAGLLLGFYFMFAVLRVTPGFIYSMSYVYQPDPQTVPLQLARAAGIRVNANEAELYDKLVPVIEAHAGSSAFIYAAPDCPEVYFLSGKRNPTPTMFDFFDDPGQHTQRVIHAIETGNVQVVALLQEPSFSPPISSELMTRLQAMFPFSEQVGRFEVRWRTQ